jgi:hypothetical protein
LNHFKKIELQKILISPFWDVPMKQPINIFGLLKSIIVSKMNFFLSINNYIALTTNYKKTRKLKHKL